MSALIESAKTNGRPMGLHVAGNQPIAKRQNVRRYGKQMGTGVHINTYMYVFSRSDGLRGTKMMVQAAQSDIAGLGIPLPSISLLGKTEGETMMNESSTGQDYEKYSLQEPVLGIAGGGIFFFWEVVRLSDKECQCNPLADLAKIVHVSSVGGSQISRGEI